VWSNQDAIAIDVEGQQQFIGVIERVYVVGPAELRIRFVDRMRLLELGKLGIGHGNVPKGQVLAFIWRLGLYSGWPDLELHGFDQNPARRPFLFAVPFGNMTWTAPGPVGFQFAETAISCNHPNGLSAITGYPTPQFDDKFLDSFPEWRPNVPKIMGVVLATEFFLARLAALQRTQIVYDLVLAANRLVENRLPGPGSPVPPCGCHPRRLP
jgi:hypothetical protein